MVSPCSADDQQFHAIAIHPTHAVLYISAHVQMLYDLDKIMTTKLRLGYDVKLMGMTLKSKLVRCCIVQSMTVKLWPCLRLRACG